MADNPSSGSDQTHHRSMCQAFHVFIPEYDQQVSQALLQCFQALPSNCKSLVSSALWTLHQLLYSPNTHKPNWRIYVIWIFLNKFTLLFSNASSFLASSNAIKSLNLISFACLCSSRLLNLSITYNKNSISFKHNLFSRATLSWKYA